MCVALNKDFSVSGVSSLSGSFTINTGVSSVPVSVLHIMDGVALEKEKQYNLTLSNQLNLEGYEFEGITVTIEDADG